MPAETYLHRTVYMPWELLKAFSEHTGLFWSSIEMEGAICDAIASAMKPQPAQVPAPALEDTSARGYQWKQVFLPDGTVLRASFGRQPYFAVVEGSEIKYGEFSLSPSAFANLQGSGNRNAWKAVWLRFPGFKDWVLADECRAVRRAMTARLFEPGEPAASCEPAINTVAPAGPRQRQYTENPPSRDDAVPMFKLLRDFPEQTVSIDDSGTGTAAEAPEPNRPLHNGANAPGAGIHPYRRQRKAGKRKATRRKKH